MTILNIILQLLSIIAYVGLMSFTILCFLDRKAQKEHREFADHTLARIYAIVSSMKIQHEFDKISELQQLLPKLIQSEQYEQAQKLQDHIKEAVKNAYEALDAFKETFGADVSGSVIKIDLSTTPPD